MIGKGQRRRVYQGRKAKQVTMRKAQKKIVVSKIVPLDPYKVAIASESVQLGKAVTATQWMMLRKRKTAHEKDEIMEKKRKLVASNDMDGETEFKEDLEHYDNAWDFFDDAEEEDSNYVWLSSL
jgi:hypothetical protein